MARRPHGIPAAKPIFALLLSPLEDLDEDPNVEDDDDGEEVGPDGDGDDDRLDDCARDVSAGTILIRTCPDVLVPAPVVADPRDIIDSRMPSVNILLAIEYLY
jgi:hypothetical protein